MTDKTNKTDLPESPEDTPEVDDGKDIIALACRAQRRDGTKGCGGMTAERLSIPNGPTFYVCQECNQRWIPVNIGGSYPY